MSALQGVYVGSVVDNRDSEGLARVLIRVPALTETRSGVWARVATLMAGADRGTLFVPEIGDEVLVAFERGDVRLPYVIGSLWNGKARPPAGASPATTKLIRSRNGVELRIVDDGNDNRVVIETPAGQRVVLEDSPGIVRIEDSNGNAVTLSPAGVEVVAAGTVKLAASVIDASASMVNVHANIARFDGVVQCDTLISNSVVSSSYTPGAGNIW